MEPKLYEIIGRLYVQAVDMQSLLPSLGEKDQEIQKLKEELAKNRNKLAELAKNEFNATSER